MSKKYIQSWIASALEAPALSMNFLNDLHNYVVETSNPSLLAINRGQAERIIEEIKQKKAEAQCGEVLDAMLKRVRICEAQGDFSLSQKSAKQARRYAEASGKDNSGIHPAPARFSAEQIAETPVLHYFHYSHLPLQLQDTSKYFCDLAEYIATQLPKNAERTKALNKLLEAKDCAVRANLPG